MKISQKERKYYEIIVFENKYQIQQCITLFKSVIFKETSHKY